jgi:hypothetical protein
MQRNVTQWCEMRLEKYHHLWPHGTQLRGARRRIARDAVDRYHIPGL